MYSSKVVRCATSLVAVCLVTSGLSSAQQFLVDFETPAPCDSTTNNSRTWDLEDDLPNYFFTPAPGSFGGVIYCSDNGGKGGGFCGICPPFDGQCAGVMDIPAGTCPVQLLNFGELMGPVTMWVNCDRGNGTDLIEVQGWRSGVQVDVETFVADPLQCVNGWLQITVSDPFGLDQVRWEVPGVACGDPTGPRFMVDNISFSPALLGSSYCGPANDNSTGNPSTLSLFGSDVWSDQDLLLTADNWPANSFGFLILSETQGFLPNPGGSCGDICVAAGVHRWLDGNVLQTNTGLIVQQYDFATMIGSPSGNVPALTVVSPGDTWNFQVWYRDFPGACFGSPDPTSNFTQAISVTFQ